MRLKLTLLNLGTSQGSVDSRSSLGGVSTKERVLIEEEHAATTLNDGVSSRQTSKTSAYNNYLGHFSFKVHAEGRVPAVLRELAQTQTR